MKPFVHLHTHSHYSLLNALPKIDDLVRTAQSDGMEALALTDDGNLYGAVEFYMRCKKAEIKPIIGVDFYVALRTRHDKEARIDNRRARLVLLAKNDAGYKNLIQLVTKSHIEGFYYKPRIDHELLEDHSDGLIAILPSFSSEVSRKLKENDEKEALEKLRFYKEVFKKDLYAEITHHPEIEGHTELVENIIKLSKKESVPLVAAHDVYYLKKEDKTARDVVVKIQTTNFGDNFGNEDEDFSFITQKKANEYFKEHSEALENTKKIADACNLEIEMKWTFPNFVIESGREPNAELKHIAYEGIKGRGLEETPELVERLEYELKVIKDKDYATYFLAVQDLLRFAHENGILTTIRGSVAGSLVTYLIRVTNVNPLAYKIPFERFLNPERPSAPDIDMDFADNRRDEVIQYAREKYGEDKVAQIGTFGTMLARGVVRDVARALGYPYSVGDQIAKLIPMGSQGFPMTIEKAFEESKELVDLHKKDEDVQRIIELSKKIEGNARHISIHAAGVVIAPKPLHEYVPVQFDPKGGKVVTQYDMYSVGEDGIGLLKFDFLGIKNLAILADAVKRVKKIRDIDIDIENVPLDDKNTFELLSKGETEGLFQLNGSGMTHFLKELKPTSIHDINAMVALYRPGPMDNIPEYIKRKHNPKYISYPDPRMEEYLKESLGVIVYQEDVLLSAIKLAGYSWLEADKFRKAIGKKIPAEMAAQEAKLSKGIVENGQTKEFAAKLWKLFEPFQGYGFNKAHAASYGKVAYQTAYMKANFPVEYMSAVLSADAGHVDKVSESIAECARMGIPVLPPDVNESFGPFSVVPEGKGNDPIRFGLHSIKNFGEGIADIIIDERKNNGKFASLADFLERIQDRNLNKKSLEALIKCGALDSLENRGKMYSNMETLLAYHKEFAQMPEGQDSLFGGLETKEEASTLKLAEGEPIDEKERLAWEKELLGLYVSGHPLDAYKETLKERPTIRRIDEELREGMLGVAYGIIEDVREINTKKGDKMAFIKISDFTGTVEVVLFPKIYAANQDLVAPENCVAIKGRKSLRNGETSLVAEALKKLEIVSDKKQKASA